MDKFKELQNPLPIESIDFRIQSINKGGFATILAYKDARVDINRLNEVCGVLGWQRQHTRDNKNCIVSIWDSDEKHWVSKEDTGTESKEFPFTGHPDILVPRAAKQALNFLRLKLLEIAR